MGEIVWLHEIPVFIILDRDPRFTLRFLGKITKGFRHLAKLHHDFLPANKWAIGESYSSFRGYA